MDQLFAPWRMDWVNRDDREADFDGCLFCNLPSVEDREARIIARNEHGYILLNNAPYAPGHVMIVPTRHIGEFYDLTEEEMLAISRLKSVAMKTIETTYGTQGFNVGMNIGKAGGASIAGHLHVHVIPRWQSDVTFMATTADTQVIPEELDRSYDRLRSALADLLELDDDCSDGAITIKGRVNTNW